MCDFPRVRDVKNLRGDPAMISRKKTQKVRSSDSMVVDDSLPEATTHWTSPPAQAGSTSCIQLDGREVELGTWPWVHPPRVKRGPYNNQKAHRTTMAAVRRTVARMMDGDDDVHMQSTHMNATRQWIAI